MVSLEHFIVKNHGPPPRSDPSKKNINNSGKMCERKAEGTEANMPLSCCFLQQS